MAGRRLAISSLLCDDDSPPPSSATRSSPPPSPPKSLLTPDTVVLAPHLLRPRPDRPDPSCPEREQLGASPSNSHQQREPVRNFLPLSLQSTSFRRRTPPPDQPPAAHHTLDRPSLYPRHGKSREEPVTTVSTQPLVSHRVDAFNPLAAERQGRPDLPRHQPTPYLPSPHHRLFPSPSRSDHLSPPPRHLPHLHSPAHSHRTHTPHSPIGRATGVTPLLQTNPSPSYFPQRASASPLNLCQSPSPMAPPPQPIPYQSSPSPEYRRPSAPPESSPPTSSAYSPTLSRSIPISMSSFPSSLLNPASPSMQSPLGGLEALVQAATEERRRISGEVAHTSERRTEGFRSSSSRSPEIPYRPSDLAPARTLTSRHVHHSPSMSPITSHVFEPRGTEEVTGSLDVDADPRPPKRRRRSDSHSGNESIHGLQSSTFANSRLSPEIHHPSMLPPTIETLVAPSPVQVQRKEWLEELAPPVNLRTPSGSASEDRGDPQPQKTDDVDALASSSRTPKSQERSPSALSPATTTEAKPVQTVESNSRRPISVGVPLRASPPVHVSLSSHFSPDPTATPTVVSPKDHRMNGTCGATPGVPTPARSPVHTSSAVRAPSPARLEVVPPVQTPTLEQELEEIAGVVPESNAMDVDVDGEIAREFELAAAVDTPPVDRRTDVVANTVTDVDDELLILVGDTSSRSSMHSRPREKFQQAKVPKATNVASTSSTIRHSSSKQDGGALPFFPPATAHPSLPSRAVSAALVKSERESMPPPPTTPVMKDMDSMSDRTGTPKADDRPAVPAKKKTAQKPKQTQSKQNQPPKPKPKPTGLTKSKAKVTKDKDGAGAAAKGKKGSPFPAGNTAAVKKAAASARSRSASVMPAGCVGPEVEQDKDKDKEAASTDEDDEEAEDKLYCICKTLYDEDRVMIACDRCDEWYHTSCVHMPDLEIDLVDQFICPPCVNKNSGLSLRTTWKRRCLFGLKQRNPASPEACHKPSRGAFSKYCSDECGVKYMRMRINYWAEEGGDRERLWESVKNAEKREGVAVSAELAREQAAMDVDGNNIRGSDPRNGGPIPGIVKPAKSSRDRELERLHAKLDEVVQKREAMKKEMDVILWREKVTEHAARRSESVDECGWDQRLCFGEEDVAEFGAGVLESYEGGQNRQDTMQVDSANEGEWWCTGKKKCNRHAGWQKLRLAEVEYEKEMKDQALQKLTTREREIRKRIEDILDPKARIASFDDTSITVPQKKTAFVEKSVPNGQAKTKPNGDSVKKGKKRKSAVT